VKAPDRVGDHLGRKGGSSTHVGGRGYLTKARDRRHRAIINEDPPAENRPRGLVMTVPFLEGYVFARDLGLAPARRNRVGRVGGGRL
jgi:hypothetical protein